MGLGRGCITHDWCSCVPGSELGPVSGLPVSATCLGGLGLPFVWHPETKQSSNWTQLCPEKAALVTPSPSLTWLAGGDGALGPGCGVDKVIVGLLRTFAFSWGCPAVSSGGGDDCEAPPQAPEGWLGLGLFGSSCLGLLKLSCAPTWLRIQTWLKILPAPLLGAHWYIPGSSPQVLRG